MAERPGASPMAAALAGRLTAALAVMVAAAMVAAACSGSREATEPTATVADATSGPSPEDPASTPVEADIQESANDSGGAASEGDGSVGDGASDRGESGGTPETEGVASEAEVSDGAESDGARREGAESEGAVSEGGESEASEGAESEGALSEGAESEGGVPEGGVSGESEDGVEPELFVSGPIAPLTGSITTDLSLAQRRPLAVKVGNGDRKDRPQAGLAAADIVYEVLVEAGFTRFIAVFHSEIPSRVGPVRSARSSDFDILADLATPYLATSGANSTVLREMRQAARDGTLIDVGAGRMGAPYARDRSRPAPHNLYFYYENLGGGDSDSLPGGLPDAPPVELFEYGTPNPPGLPDAAGVTVAYTTLYGGEVSHVWDSFLGGWVRIQDGTLHMTETDFGVAEIAPANVVVVSMPYGRSAADRRSPQALSYGSGNALVLTAGSVHEAFWGRSEDRVGFRFWDSAGSPLSLSAGSTWLLLGNTSRRWPLAEVTVLTSSDATRLLADARAAADAEANAASAS